MNIIIKIDRQKIKYVAYVLVFLVSLIGNKVLAANVSSKIDLVAGSSACVNSKGAITGITIGSYYWPSDKIFINISSQCIVPILEKIAKQGLIDSGSSFGYRVQTDLRKLYINDPKINLIDPSSSLVNGGFEMVIVYSGWEREKIAPAICRLRGLESCYSNKRYWTSTVTWTIEVSFTEDWRIISTPTIVLRSTDVENVNPFLEKAIGKMVDVVTNFFLFLYFGELATEIDLRDTIVQSTPIVPFFESITGLSDAESRVRQILDGIPLLDLSVNSEYVRFSLPTSSFYENAKKDFRSVAINASNGLLSDADADSIFADIRYPQGPSALNLLIGRGIGHENNQAPSASSLSNLQVNFNKSRYFTPASDPEDDPLSYSLVKAPSHGTLYTLNNGEFRLRYEPTRNFSGSDQFEYRAKDPYGLSDTGKVSVIVNPNRTPTALRTGLVINWNEAVSFVPRAGDPDGDNLKYSVPEDKNPKHGTVTPILNGSRLDYIADLDFEGSDQFEYRAQDPYGLFATAQVDVTVIRPKKNLVVNKTGTGKGIISSNPDFIDCGPYCLEDVPIDSVITLVPTPDSGSVFSGWDGGCSSADLGSCTLTMNKAQIVIARFDTAPTSFTLTVDKTGTGSGIVTSNAEGIDCGDDCTEDYPAGTNTQVTLTPALEAGSTFRGWSGACSGTNACTVIMSQNRDVGATFETAVPTVFTVSNLNDSGAGSLRQAITDANNNPGNDSIFFQAGLGGTITLTNGQLDIKDSVVIRGPGAKLLAISGNNASRILTIDPGALGTVDISGLTLKEGNDKSSKGGGGMIIENGTVTISNSTLTDNSANVGGGGGGIRKYGPGWLNVTNTTISGNSALDEFDQGEGGGIRTEQDTLTISNSTVSGNSAANAGGISFDDGRLTISNSTVTGNAALIGGGGIFTAGGDLFLENSVIAGNTAPADKEIQNFGTTHSLGHNLFGENGLSGVTEGVTLADNDLILAGDITTVIDPLADNGGQTLTHLPVAGGPAIDVGNNLLIPLGLNNDQRGIDFPRIMNGTVDIGAVERIVKHTLSVSQTGGNGTITSSSGSIDCNANCTADLIGDTEVTLTATPASGFRFAGWSGACSGAGVCTVSMGSDKSVTAIFVAVPVVTVTATDNTASEVGLTTGTFKFARTGNKTTALTISYTVTGTATSGSDYLGLESSVTIPVGSSTVTKTVTPLQDTLLEQDETILLTLTQSPDYALGTAGSAKVTLTNGNALSVVKSGEGKVSSSPVGIDCGTNCKQNYTNGTSVTLTATPDPGYLFTGWGGACSGPATTCTLAMNAAKNVTASFVWLHRSSWKRALIH